MDENLERSVLQDFSNLTLRPIALSDVDDLMVWATDDRVTKFCMWDTYTSREQALDYIQTQAIPHPWMRAICLGNRAVGAISVAPGSGADICRGELGYVLAFEYWGKGIITRAVGMVVASIFEEWPHLQRLQAVVNVENRASQRVLEKTGFVKEGVLSKYHLFKGEVVDVVMFSVVAGDARS